MIVICFTIHPLSIPNSFLWVEFVTLIAYSRMSTSKALLKCLLDAQLFKLHLQPSLPYGYISLIYICTYVFKCCMALALSY